jgi:hypothetical protein
MEILATVPIYNHPWIYNLTFAVAMVTIIIGIAIGLFISIEHRSWGAFIVGVALVVTGGFGVSHSSGAIERTSYLDYTKYKVTINEEIGARELLNEYEILSREGEIFTIKEIEVDE